MSLEEERAAWVKDGLKEAIKIVRLYRGECGMMRDQFKRETQEWALYDAAGVASIEIEKRLEEKLK